MEILNVIDDHSRRLVASRAFVRAKAATLVGRVILAGAALVALPGFVTAVSDIAGWVDHLIRPDVEADEVNSIA